MKIERVIAIPPEQAWESLADFSRVHKVHPKVETVDQVSDIDRGVGAIRTCHFYDGKHATEKVTDWNDTERTYTVEFIDSSFPVKKLAVDFTILPEGSDSSKMIAECDVDEKYGFFGKLLGRFVLKPKLAQAIGGMFAGMEHHINTGQEVTNEFNPSTPPTVV